MLIHESPLRCPDMEYLHSQSCYLVALCRGHHELLKSQADIAILLRRKSLILQQSWALHSLDSPVY